MKSPSKQSVAEATDWIYNDFKRARKSLVGVYLLIIFGVIALFSTLIIIQAKETSEGVNFLTGNQIVITKARAKEIFKETLPKEKITKEEYELENGTLYFVMEYGDQKDLKVNLFTGDTFIPEENTSFVQSLVDDFDEKVIWIGLLVFLLASGASVFVANKTLSPIVKSIRKEKEFVSGAAHELRNPLASLQATLEGARLGNTPIREEFLNDMLSETKRLIQTSDSLLSIEKAQYRKKEITETSLREILNEILKRLDVELKEKKIQIKEVMEDRPLSIDKADLGIILYNLLHNAIKFSHPEGQIKITWQDKNLSISDNGFGIPPEKIPFVFDRFYKADNSRNTSGSGLGLSIVKEIIVSYGKNIKVTSEAGKETKFTIFF